ncbi:hypothetical protein BRC85_03095 [Halobacteriales archaeon QS_1_69_70]|nr:MAG: hypothetical protein BRC85_03095 [Halobacteriales archaeon QS_1_69_70]
MELSEEIDPARAWLAALAAGVVLTAAAALAFPRRVADGVLWRYFWGPVDADAHAATCAVRSGGTTERLYTAAACRAADGVVAQPGYTTVSTVSYALILVFMLVGVLLLLRELGVEMSPHFFYALFPFMLLGGALRVVEDLIISPFIYFVMFAFTLSALVASVALERRGAIEHFEPALAVAGTAGLLVALGALAYASIAFDPVAFNPLFFALVVGGASLVGALFWLGSERYAPVVNEGTGWMGILVVWGHTVDGLANVLSLDWGPELVGQSYGSKHVVNRATVRVTESVQPAWLSEAVGTAWPFVLIKVAAAVLVVWVFDDRIFEESPRYAYLLLIAILAVGLGPGTRDTLRATLGI